MSRSFVVTHYWLRRVTRAVADCVDDDFGVRCFVKYEIWLRRCRHPPDPWVFRRRPDPWMHQQKVDHGLDPCLNAAGTLRGSSDNVAENLVEVSKGWAGIAQLHSPCLAQTAATAASSAKSPCAAAARERSIAARSSGAKGATASKPAKASTARAITSWSPSGNRLACSKACCRSLVIAY